MQTSVVLLYIVTAVISIIFALFLFKLARMSSHAPVREDQRQRKDSQFQQSGTLTDFSVDHVVMKEISKVVDPRHSSEIAGH